MELPPRRKDGKILSRPIVKWIIVPWGLFWGVAWIALSTTAFWMHVGFTRIAAMEPTASFGAVASGHSVCEYAGTMIEEEGIDGRKFVQDELPFHCRCRTREHPFAPIVVWEQWGVPTEEMKPGSAASPEVEACKEKEGHERVHCVKEARATLATADFIQDGLKGKVTKLYSRKGDYEKIPKPEVNACSLDGENSEKNQKWCWTDSNLQEEHKLHLDDNMNCMVVGSWTARSMALLSAVTTELTMLLAVSSELPFWRGMFRNKLLLLLVVLAILVNFGLIYVPIAARILSIMPLKYPAVFTALALPLFGLIVMELLKIGYRYDLAAYNDLRMYHAKAAAHGLLSHSATDEEVRACRLKNPRETLDAALPAT